MLELAINAFILVCLTGLTLIIRRLWAVQDQAATRHDELERRVTAIQIDLPTQYIRRRDIDTMEARLIAELGKMELSMNKHFDTIYGKIDGKQDKEG